MSKSVRYFVTEIREERRCLLIVTKEPQVALALANDCRSRSGPFHRVEITDSEGRLVFDCELLSEIAIAR